MGRPTLAEQIAKAAAEGNMDKVKELAGKLSPAKSKPKVKPKSKVKKPKVLSVHEQVQVNPKETDSFISAARSSNDQRPSKYIDEDGNERVRARIVPFKVIKNRKNAFKDNLEEQKEDIEYDKGHKRKIPPREAVKKIKAICSRCKEPKLVWPVEVTHSNWACNECLISNKRG